VERKRVERREMGSKSVHVLVVWRSKEKREIDREMQGNGGGVMAGMAILHILICLKKKFGPHTRACSKAKLGKNMMSQKGYLFVEFSDLKMEKNMDEIWRKKIWVEA
jgi:hypothetical protein